MKHDKNHIGVGQVQNKRLVYSRKILASSKKAEWTVTNPDRLVLAILILLIIAFLFGKFNVLSFYSSTCTPTNFPSLGVSFCVTGPATMSLSTNPSFLTNTFFTTTYGPGQSDGQDQVVANALPSNLDPKKGTLTTVYMRLNGTGNPGNLYYNISVENVSGNCGNCYPNGVGIKYVLASVTPYTPPSTSTTTVTSLPTTGFTSSPTTSSLTTAFSTSQSTSTVATSFTTSISPSGTTSISTTVPTTTVIVTGMQPTYCTSNCVTWGGGFLNSIIAFLNGLGLNISYVT